MEKFTIREARMSDLDILLRFEQDLIATERPWDPTLREGMIHYYDLAKYIVDPAVRVLVAEVDGRVVASGDGLVREGKPFNNFSDYVFLGFMYVEPAYRGMGINQAIISDLKSWALQLGLREVRLQVYDENIAAIKAYEKVGFRKILCEMRVDAAL